MASKTHIVYRIYYGEHIVYVGRTNQPLRTRIHGHLFAKPMHRVINIELVSKVEYAEFETEADMNLYEIYYILTLHPLLNCDDKTRDYPTVKLPEVEFKVAEFPKWNEWKQKIDEQENNRILKKARYQELQTGLSYLRSCRNKLTEDEYWAKRDVITDELNLLQKELYG